MYKRQDLKVANELFLKIRALITQIDAEIINKLGSDYGASNWSWGDNENEMGKYIRYKDEMDIFYGFNFQLLAQYPDRNDFLFGVAIYENIVNKDSLDDSTKFVTVNDNEEIWYCFKLDKYNYVNLSSENTKMLIEEIVNTIKSHI